jgi:hypothetical protein
VLADHGTPFHHSLSSVKRWEGIPEDYQPIHDWFDETKALMSDFRHRALRHHAEGIFLCEQVFGTTISISTCGKCGEDHFAGQEYDHEFVLKRIPVRWIGEQHVTEDLGFIPSANQWLERITAEPWMFRGARKLSQELSQESEMRPS